jgi:hypothetical protein
MLKLVKYSNHWALKGCGSPFHLKGIRFSLSVRCQNLFFRHRIVLHVEKKHECAHGVKCKVDTIIYLLKLFFERTICLTAL